MTHASEVCCDSTYYNGDTAFLWHESFMKALYKPNDVPTLICGSKMKREQRIQTQKNEICTSEE
jgi:hypothetical protein